MNLSSWLPILFALAFAPLLPGIINRVKAVFAGRQGAPLLQLYYDLARLLHKGAVYSATTTWVFRAAPVVAPAAACAGLLLLPFGAVPAPLAFSGDFLVLFYLLGTSRFFTVAAALDTGSAFEGMGASREVQFSVLAEPALFLALAALARLTQSLSLSTVIERLSPAAWAAAAPTLSLVAVALFLVLLAENSRIPVDDPNTHLELTMIHEVMVLDHSGPDFAFILYGAALKLWIFASLAAGIVIPLRSDSTVLNLAAMLAGVMTMAALVGVVESVMARLRLVRVPQLLVGAASLAAVGFILLM